jgi:hypothetical protein
VTPQTLPALFGTALGLAAGAGLNSYAVLLVFGAAAQVFPEEFTGPLARLFASPPALTVFLVLFGLEFFVDKIPFLDHFWDLLHAVVRPVAGAVLAVAIVWTQLDTTFVVLAGAGGAFVALVTHFVKSATRLTSNALTAGVANIALSLAEDVLAFLQALVGLFLPIVSLLVVIAIGGLFLTTVPRIARSIDLLGRRRRRAPPAAA